MDLLNDNSPLNVTLNVLLLLSRYLHIVASMLLVGGVLFYEMVVPRAIADLNDQQQLAIFARARIVFRWITWVSVVLLLATGTYLTFRRMNVYIQSEFPSLPTGIFSSSRGMIPPMLKSGMWWAAHSVASVIAIIIALYLVSGDRPPSFPVNWLRLDLMVLLIAVFFASVTHQVDQFHQDRTRILNAAPYMIPSREMRREQPDDQEDATTPAPAPAPTTQATP